MPDRGDPKTAYGNLTDVYEPAVRPHIAYDDDTGSFFGMRRLSDQKPAQRWWAYGWM